MPDGSLPNSPFGLLAVSTLIGAAVESAKVTSFGSGYPILTASMAAIAGVAGGVLGNLANRRMQKKGDKEEALKDALHNEHLALAAARAVKLTLLKEKVGNDDLDTPRLADAAEQYWVKLQASQTEDVAVYSEPELESRLIEHLAGNGASKGLSPEQWLLILEGSRPLSPVDLDIDPGRMRLLAARLAENYPTQLYAAFKSDLASGGAAFGGIVLRLLCRVAARNQSGSAPAGMDGKDARALRKQMDQLMKALERDARPASGQLDKHTLEVLNEVARVRRLVLGRAWMLLGTGCVLAAVIIGLLLTSLYQTMPRYEARVSTALWRVPAGASGASSAFPDEPFYTGDGVRITVEPQGEAFLYAFWRSESGKVFPLHPGNFGGGFSDGVNPVQKGSKIGIPKDDKPMTLTDPAGETYQIFVLSSPGPQTEIERIFKEGFLSKSDPLFSTLLAASAGTGGEGRKGEPVISAAAQSITNSPLQNAIAHGQVQVQKFPIRHDERGK